MPRTPRKNGGVPLSEIAYHKIKEQIVILALAPGAQIDESGVAQTLNIGRTPIREALFRLAAEGLLNVVTGRGFFVRDITLRDVKDLFEALMIMERAAVVLAAKRIDPSALERLSGINRRFQVAWNEKRYLEVTTVNSQFHREIYAAAGNAYMSNYLGSLQNQSQRLAYICFSRPVKIDLKTHAEESIQDHGEMIEYLRRGDEAGALKAITRHIERFRRRVIDYTEPSSRELEIPG